MTPFVILRHGPTAWNGEKRLQGSSDIPLSDAGAAEVATWSVPEAFREYDWLCSPLSRAQQTASLLGLTPETDPLLTEMSFGEWEGEILPELRQRLGAEMQANEDRGLDFLPPNGESPRMVQQRLAPLLKRLTRPTGAVAHFGVIRAIYAWASGWPMLGKPPVKIGHGTCHHFEIDDQGTPHIVEMNISLEPPS